MDKSLFRTFINSHSIVEMYLQQDVYNSILNLSTYQYLMFFFWLHTYMAIHTQLYLCMHTFIVSSLEYIAARWRAEYPSLFTAKGSTLNTLYIQILLLSYILKNSSFSKSATLIVPKQNKLVYHPGNHKLFFFKSIVFFVQDVTMQDFRLLQLFVIWTNLTYQERENTLF